MAEKLTDKEIIKALECCVNWGSTTSCADCPLCNTGCVHFSKLKETLDLINRQQAEIEKLNVELVGMRGACNSYKMHYDNAQAEIERLNRLVVKERDRKKIISEIWTRIKKYSFEDTRMKEGGGLERVSIVFRDDVNKCLRDFLKEWIGDDK